MKNNKIPHCQDSSNRKTTKYHTIRTVPTSMKNNKIPQPRQSQNTIERCWNCSDSVVFCCFSIETVLTVWYFVVFHGYWNWPDSVVFCCFSIGFWNCPGCGILLFFMDVGTVLAVWLTVPIEKQQNTTLSSQFQHH
jgi:hypothetical protein